MALTQETIDALAQKGAERGIDLRPGLALVEDRLQRQVAAELPFLDESARYLVDAGGKRFRPMLVLLAGLLGGAESTDERLVDGAVIVELVHLSTLYHDDVIDAAEVRRGAEAAHVKWSNTIAILTGDFLLARASLLSAALGVEVTRIMAATIADLCQGQIREVQGSREARDHGGPAVEPTREHYLQVIGEKTASLIASSCRLGALLSGQSRDAVETLTAYGWRLGMTFQLADDVLDVVGEPGESGKLPGTDIREGVRTLPILEVLAAEGPGSDLARLLDDPSPAAAERALAIVRDHPALELARDAARLEAEQAKDALREIAVAPGREAALDGLLYLADYAVERVR